MYAKFLQKPMTQLYDFWQESTMQQENVVSVHESENGDAKDNCHYTSLFRGAAHINCSLEYWIPDHISTVSHNLCGNGTHLFIKRLRKKLNKKYLGNTAENKEYVKKYVRTLCWGPETVVNLCHKAYVIWLLTWMVINVRT